MRQMLPKSLIALPCSQDLVITVTMTLKCFSECICEVSITTFKLEENLQFP